MSNKRSIDEAMKSEPDGDSFVSTPGFLSARDARGEGSSTGGGGSGGRGVGEFARGVRMDESEQPMAKSCLVSTHDGRVERLSGIQGLPIPVPAVGAGGAGPSTSDQETAGNPHAAEIQSLKWRVIKDERSIYNTSIRQAKGMQHYVATGELLSLLKPSRMLLGIHNDEGNNAYHVALIFGREQQLVEIFTILEGVKEDNPVALKKIINKKNNKGQTPLVLAIQVGNGEYAGRLFGQFRTDHKKLANEGNTFLHVLMSPPVAPRETYVGKDVALTHILASIDKYGTNQGDKVALGEVLRECLMMRNFDGYSPLHIAARATDEEPTRMVKKVIAKLIELGIDVSEVFNFPAGTTGMTALHHLIQQRQLQRMKTFFEMVAEDDIDIDKKSYDGSTPLYLAVQENLPEFVKFLLEEGADQYVTDTCTERDYEQEEEEEEDKEEEEEEYEGETVVQLARRLGNMELLTLLEPEVEERGANGVVKSEKNC